MPANYLCLLHHLQNYASRAVISGMKKYLVSCKAAKWRIWEWWQTLSFHGYRPPKSIPPRFPGNSNYPPTSKPVGPTPDRENRNRHRNTSSSQSLDRRGWGHAVQSRCAHCSFTTELFTPNCSVGLTATTSRQPSEERTLSRLLLLPEVALQSQTLWNLMQGPLQPLRVFPESWTNLSSSPREFNSSSISLIKWN